LSQTQSSCDGAVSEYHSVSYSQPYLQFTEILHVIMVTICSLLGTWPFLKFCYNFVTIFLKFIFRIRKFLVRLLSKGNVYLQTNPRYWVPPRWFRTMYTLTHAICRRFVLILCPLDWSFSIRRITLHHSFRFCWIFTLSMMYNTPKCPADACNSKADTSSYFLSLKPNVKRKHLLYWRHW
jgi:hypothetical protein